MWEYKVIMGCPSEADLNMWGAEGWELVAATGHRAYMKRPYVLAGGDVKFEPLPA